MKIPIFSLLGVSILLAISSMSIAEDGAIHEPSRSLLQHPELGSAYAEASLPQHYSQQIFLWPEDSQILKDGINLIIHDEFARRNARLVITHPSLLVYPPETNSSRSAIIVFPSGGYKGVAIGKESTIGFNGSDVCNWLNEAGVTCIVLKYRVPNSGCSYNANIRQHVTPEIPMALQDAQRAISIVRFHAKSFDVDPNKIGVLGFSAGGNLAILASAKFNDRTYAAIDEMDLVSIRPDFSIPVYPGHLTMEHKNKTPKSIAATELNSDIKVSAEIPPTLLIHAKDDRINPIHYSELYQSELKNVGVEVKYIRYETGGHAFGVKTQHKDSDQWTTDAIQWLKQINIL